MGEKSISDAGPRLRQMNDALEENDRLQAEIARLRSQPCPYVTGNVTRYCTLTPLTLTDAERYAVLEAAGCYVAECDELQAAGVVVDAKRLAVRDTLRGLLNRMTL